MTLRHRHHHHRLAASAMDLCCPYYYYYCHFLRLCRRPRRPSRQSPRAEKAIFVRSDRCANAVRRFRLSAKWEDMSSMPLELSDGPPISNNIAPRVSTIGPMDGPVGGVPCWPKRSIRHKTVRPSHRHNSSPFLPIESFAQ